MSRAATSGAWLAAAFVLAAALALIVPMPAAGETASTTVRPAQAGYLDLGEEHTCAILADRSLRCWGAGLAGRLGNGSDADILLAAAAPAVDLGPGRSARAVAAGDFHNCAILDDRSVRCWGFGQNGRLGYSSTLNVYSPAAAGPVNLGAGAVAITAGASHTCAILDGGSVRCWGNGGSGRLGYGNLASVGDDEVPAAVGPVDLGPGRTARAIAAGDFHTCAILDDGSLRCWGFGDSGQLGYGNTEEVGDTETPGQVGPVPLPAGRVVRAVAGGTGHTCAILDDATVRCWGFGANGRLGYGSADTLTSVGGPVAIGPGRSATGIAVADAHTCATLDDGTVRCWGFGGGGRLGYQTSASVGATPGTTPDTAGPVAVGAGRVTRALSAGYGHSCALLDDGTVRCWGLGAAGRLGYGDATQVAGDGFPVPAAKGPVPLGAMAGSLADLSVSIAASAAQIPLGGTVGLSVAVANGGPDAAAVVLSVPPSGGAAYTAAAPSQGGFDAAGTWNVGVLPPGGRASLQLTARLGAPGTHTIAARVAAASIPDRAGEDDGAAVVVVVPGATSSARTLRALPRGLKAKVARFPRRGRATRLTVSGELTLPRTRPVPRCAGRVQVRALAGKRVVASTRAALRRRAGACRYTAVLRPKASKLRGARVLTVTTRFLGNAQMRPRSARSLKVRVR